MAGDNRIFNVNGESEAFLARTLSLVFAQSDFTAKGWVFDKKHGLILIWSAVQKANPFPSALTAEQCLPFVLAWLKSDEAKTVECTGWDEDFEHDGDNSRGWRVYCEDWGKVAGYDAAICAIKPAFIWHGK